MKLVALVLAVCGIAAAADQKFLSAPLQPPAERKAAADFVLKNASNETVKLADYRGKVVLLDFWATWCTGCKQEIPWFSEFESKYGSQGFAVVGVSLDEDGWKVLRPFLTEHKIPYQMVLGDQTTAKGYGIESMPDTFLIDQQGRIAAAYISGLVNRENIETNIKSLLAHR